MKRKHFIAGLLLWLTPFFVFAGAPDIVLKDLNGKDRNVSEFIGKGKWVAVMIWAHDCHICNQEVHEMTFFHAEHKNKDAIVLGVTIDGQENLEEAKKFVKRHSLNFTSLVAEPEHEVLIKFGGGSFFGTPTFYIYDPEGELVARNIGPVSGDDIERFIKDAPKKADSKTDGKKDASKGKKG